jgi:hypothetical protein
MERHAPDARQKRNAILTALTLAAVALGIYLTVIAQFVVYG